MTSNITGVVIITKGDWVIVQFDCRISWRDRAPFTNVTGTIKSRTRNVTSSSTRLLSKAYVLATWTLVALDVSAACQISRRTASSLQREIVTTAGCLRLDNLYCVTTTISFASSFGDYRTNRRTFVTFYFPPKTRAGHSWLWKVLKQKVKTSQSSSPWFCELGIFESKEWCRMRKREWTENKKRHEADIRQCEGK